MKKLHEQAQKQGCTETIQRERACINTENMEVE